MLRQSLLMTLVFGLAASVVGYLFAEPLIRFMGAKEAEVLAAATSYLRIQMIGLVGVALTSTITATLRGVGNSKTAMIYNMIANVVNVIFNYLLIYGHFGFPRMEVAGASLATIIGPVCGDVHGLLRGDERQPVSEIPVPGRPEAQHPRDQKDRGHRHPRHDRTAGDAGRPDHLFQDGGRAGHTGLCHPSGVYEHSVPFVYERAGLCRVRHLADGAEPGQEAA